MKGILCMIIRKDDGHVLATGADFEQGGAAGFSMRDNQERRARLYASQDFLRKHCSSTLLDGINGFTSDRIIDELRNRDRIMIQIIEIGYEERDSEVA